MLLPAAQNGRRRDRLFGLDASPLDDRRDELVVLLALLRRNEVQQLEEFLEPDVLGLSGALGPDLRGNQISDVCSTAWRFMKDTDAGPCRSWAPESSSSR